MNGQQNIVALGGVALIGANYWATQKATINAGLFNSSATTADTTAAHAALRNVALELLFVGVATLLAGVSDGLGSAMVAVIVALGILWCIRHFAPTQNGSN